jgi:hypothetical protein
MLSNIGNLKLQFTPCIFKCKNGLLGYWLLLTLEAWHQCFDDLFGSRTLPATRLALQLRF